MEGFGMDSVFIIVLYIIILVVSLACLIGSIIIYRMFISTSSVGEFVGKFKTQKYLKALFRFDRFIAPKIIQYFYGLAVLSIIGGAIIFFFTMLFMCIYDFEIRTLLGAIFGTIGIIIFGEIFVRIGYEFAILLFKMNENLQVIREAQVNQGFVVEEIDDRSAAEAFSSTFDSFKNTVNGQAANFRGNAQQPVQQPPQQPAQSVKVCPNCGFQSSPQAKFCKGCGNPL